MKVPDVRNLFVDDHEVSDEEFRRQNLVNMIAATVLMIVGPLFIYYGFYHLTWPSTARWGSLAIAIGVFLLAFGFSLWQDRQIQTLRRTYARDAAEIKDLLGKNKSRQGGKNDGQSR